MTLSVSLADRKVRQIQVPGEMVIEVEDGLRAFAQTQELLKQVRLQASGVRAEGRAVSELVKKVLIE